jgi:hypothetical protein
VKPDTSKENAGRTWLKRTDEDLGTRRKDQDCNGEDDFQMGNKKGKWMKMAKIARRAQEEDQIRG